MLAFARATVPQWTVIIDRSRSDIFAAARRTLELEIALLGGVALLDLAILWWIFRRAREEARIASASALQRRRRYEREHQVATTLQRSLLAEVPRMEGVDSAARYQAGSTGLEVGGDWFDVLRRPDGIVQITVGDVAGRGVAAAALMGQLRSAFRAYAYEHSSPAAVMTRLQRHIVQDEMATAICIAIDPYTREVLYASAGHPPPLLRDDDSGSITPLSDAQFSLLGPAAVRPVLDARLSLPRHATLVAYTDGMVERRNEVIDAGIDRLARRVPRRGLRVAGRRARRSAAAGGRRGHGGRRRHRAARDALRRRAGGASRWTSRPICSRSPRRGAASSSGSPRAESARRPARRRCSRSGTRSATRSSTPIRSTTTGIPLRIVHAGDDVRVTV